MNYNTPHFKLGLITAAVAALSACGGGAGSISTTVMPWCVWMPITTVCAIPERPRVVLTATAV
mgnify:CR=1 FL=1